MAASLETACRECQIANVRSIIHHMEDRSPEAVAESMLKLGAKCDVLAVVAAEHPLITQTVQTLADKGTACFGMISSISAPCGFRSYVREHAAEFELLEPMITFEDRRVARELTRSLIAREPELAGLFISGGGISGVLDALRETGYSQKIVTVGYELMNE